jgi:hypothetical protein
MYVVVPRSKYQANQSQKDMKKNGMGREKASAFINFKTPSETCERLRRDVLK